MELGKLQGLNKLLLDYKKQFIEMRDQLNDFDTHLALPLVIRAVMTVYSVMLNIYILAISTATVNMTTYIKILNLSTGLSISEMIISSFICGSVHEKSEQIYAILDEFNANDLSD